MQSDNIQGPTEASFTFSATKFIYLLVFLISLVYQLALCLACPYKSIYDD